MTQKFEVTEDTLAKIATYAEQMILTYPTRGTIAMGIGMLHAIDMMQLDPNLSAQIQEQMVESGKKLGALYQEELETGFRLILNQRQENGKA